AAPLLSFFLYSPSTPALSTLSLHDALPISALLMPCALPQLGIPAMPGLEAKCAVLAARGVVAGATYDAQQKDALAKLRAAGWTRSEEHTSELQSRENLVCRLLLEKKKRRKQ